MMNMVFLKLFVAIVLRTFIKSSEKQNKFMNSELSDHFREVWSIYDTNVKENITINKITSPRVS